MNFLIPMHTSTAVFTFPSTKEIKLQEILIFHFNYFNDGSLSLQHEKITKWFSECMKNFNFSFENSLPGVPFVERHESWINFINLQWRSESSMGAFHEELLSIDTWIMHHNIHTISINLLHTESAILQLQELHKIKGSHSLPHTETLRSTIT